MSLPHAPAGAAFRRVLTRVFPNHLGAGWLSVAASLADAAFETDLSGRFTAFGRGHVLGIPADTLVRVNIGDFLVPASDGENFRAIYAAMIRRGLAWRGIVAATREDGVPGTYQLHLAPKRLETAGMFRAGKEKSPGTSGEISGACGLLIGMEALEAGEPAGFGRTAVMLDTMTGLWSARSFAEEAGRRFDRLDVEGLPGTLLLLGFSRTPVIGQNAVVARLAQELREISRPTDLVGRINATIFGLWCDGMDDLTGAERAAKFCQTLPTILPGNPCISVGLVARWPGNPEEPSGLIRQAIVALRQAERVTQTNAMEADRATGAWQVWNPGLKPPADS